MKKYTIQINQDTCSLLKIKVLQGHLSYSSAVNVVISSHTLSIKDILPIHDYFESLYSFAGDKDSEDCDDLINLVKSFIEKRSCVHRIEQKITYVCYYKHFDRIETVLRTVANSLSKNVDTMSDNKITLSTSTYDDDSC